MHAEILSCQVCGSAYFDSVYPKQHPGLKICRQCGFVFFDRTPSMEQLIAHYKTYPRHDEISPITLKRFDEIVESFAPYRKLNRILDVGCGNGHLLQAAMRQGWEAHGTEFTDEAVSICSSKGILIKKGILDVSNYPAESFDVICFIEVIEHIQNTREELAKFHRLLRKGGLLYITTPNFRALSGKFAGPAWNIIEYPEHLAYFRTTTLHRILTDAGFRKQSLKTTGFSYNRLLQSRDTNNPSPTVDETLREKTETRPVYKFAKKTINALLSYTNSGDTIKGVYIKN
jgi:2-polyprenyl-3-methyl-5-hydroxy-6-metoxy-1,4-benzoquinol methylase